MYKTLWKETFKLWVFGFFKIPMVFWLRPRIVELNNKQAVLRIPFRRRTKNHLNSMYFGALCAGADIVGGIHVMLLFHNRLDQFSFVFKDVHAEFIKRAEFDVNFVCDEGEQIANLIEKAKASHERENMVIHVNALTSQPSGDEVVARFAMTLSIKERKPHSK